MAKKEPTIEDAVEYFLEVMRRCQFENYRQINRILYTTNKNKKPSLIIPDLTLWNGVLEFSDLIESIREFSVNISWDKIRLEKTYFARDMENGWLDISDDDMTNKDRIYINIEGFNYPIEINKTIWPCRFKKDESNNFSYKIFETPYHAFAIRKKFEGKLPDTSFYIMRIFQII